MNDTDSNVYKLYRDNNTKVTICSRLFSCLYAYTIGSCLRQRSDTSNIVEEEIKLLPFDRTKDKSNLEEANNSGWRKAECRMKKRIQYHFTDHIRRWMDSDQRRFPWKLMLHLLLVVLVTTQVSLYAVDRSKMTDFLVDSDKAVKRYFKSANNEEVALYKIDDVHDWIEHIVENYYSLPDQFVALSSVCYLDNKTEVTKPEILAMSVEYLEIQECKCYQNLSNTFPDTANSFTISRQLFLPTTTSNDSDLLSNKTTCDDDSMCCTSDQCNYSIRDQVKHFINMGNLYRIKRIIFEFMLSVMFQKGIIENYNAVDVEFSVEILLNAHDRLHSSHVDVEIQLEPKLTRLCRETMRARNTFIDSIVMVISVLASIGYLLSVIRSARLAKDVKLHFLVYHKKKLKWQETHVLFNKFYILMLFTCCLLVITTVFKIITEYTETVSLRMMEEVGILLAVGVFLLWCGLFGFLKYFESLNVLLITLKLAIPSVLRFAVCMLVLFVAFTLSGWLILGPYNPQFKDPLRATETLIGIVNGDGIATAFDATSSDCVINSTMLLIFSKIYLVLFVFIFIYIVLSLFIGIFDHAYNSLSVKWRNRSRGFLWDWAEGGSDDDPTKNYPFPVPRTRDLSDKFRTQCCKLHSYSTPLYKKKSQTAPATAENIPSDYPANFTAKSDDGQYTSSDENTEEGQNSVVHHFSDSILQPPGFKRLPYHVHVCYCNPKRHYSTCRFRSIRHKRSVKNAMEEPQDASQRQIAKAKLKKGHIIEMNMNVLQEEDL